VGPAGSYYQTVTEAAKEEITLSRVFDAPAELVYRAFVDPDQLCQWFGPADFSVPYETVQSDVRTGGFQRFVLVNDADPGQRTPVDVALTEVVEDELLVGHADVGEIVGGKCLRRVDIVERQPSMIRKDGLGRHASA